MTDETTPPESTQQSVGVEQQDVVTAFVVGTGTPATSPYFGVPRFSGNDVADFPTQANAITDTFDANAVRLTESRAVALTTTLRVGTNARTTNALIVAAAGGDDIEFGHSNTAGYRSTLGSESSNGTPYLAFSASAGTNANTYKTAGFPGSVFLGDRAGGFVWSTVATASADNQTRSNLMTLNSAGVLSPASTVQITGAGGFLCRNQAGTTSFATRQAADTTDRLNIVGTGTLSWADGTNAADCTLSRSAASQMSFAGGCSLTVATQTGGGWIQITGQGGYFGSRQNTSATQLIFAGRAVPVGDTTDRFTIDASGSHAWGPGNAAVDVFLGRAAAGCLSLSPTIAPQATNVKFSMLGVQASPVNFLEWGWNQNVYAATLGSLGTGFGFSFIAFGAEAGSTAGTYKSRGAYPCIIQASAGGTLLFGSLATSAATDNQSLAQTMSIDRTGNVTASGQFISTYGSAALIFRSMTGPGYQTIAFRVTGDTVDRLNVSTDGTMQWGPGNAAADTNLYRAGASVLKTDDQFQASSLYIGGGAQFVPVPVANTALGVYGTVGDTQYLWRVTGNGTMYWGAGGTTAPDIWFGRGGVGWARLDSSGGTMAFQPGATNWLYSAGAGYSGSVNLNIAGGGGGSIPTVSVVCGAFTLSGTTTVSMASATNVNMASATVSIATVNPTNIGNSPTLTAGYFTLHGAATGNPTLYKLYAGGPYCYSDGGSAPGRVLQTIIDGTGSSFTASGYGAGVFTVISDERLKENITELDSGRALETVCAMQGVKHGWTSDTDRREYGYVAQDLYEVVPEVVMKPVDEPMAAIQASEDGETGPSVWGVDYMRLIPLLSEAIKELTGRLETLEAAVK